MVGAQGLSTNWLVTLLTIQKDMQGGLALMHGKGVVHADIKPENILMTHPAGNALNYPHAMCYQVPKNKTPVWRGFGNLPYMAQTLKTDSQKYAAVAFSMQSCLTMYRYHGRVEA